MLAKSLVSRAKSFYSQKLYEEYSLQESERWGETAEVLKKAEAAVGSYFQKGRIVNFLCGLKILRKNALDFIIQYLNAFLNSTFIIFNKVLIFKS